MEFLNKGNYWLYGFFVIIMPLFLINLFTESYLSYFYLVYIINWILITSREIYLGIKYLKYKIPVSKIIAFKLLFWFIIGFMILWYHPNIAISSLFNISNFYANLFMFTSLVVIGSIPVIFFLETIHEWGVGSGPASNKINFSSIHHPPINVALKIFPLANFKGVMLQWIHMDKVMYKKILKIDDNIAYLSNLFQKSNIIRVMGKLTQTDPNRIIIDENDRNVIENLLASYT